MPKKVLDIKPFWRYNEYKPGPDSVVSPEAGAIAEQHTTPRQQRRARLCNLGEPVCLL